MAFCDVLAPGDRSYDTSGRPDTISFRFTRPRDREQVIKKVLRIKNPGKITGVLKRSFWKFPRMACRFNRSTHKGRFSVIAYPDGFHRPLNRARPDGQSMHRPRRGWASRFQVLAPQQSLPEKCSTCFCHYSKRQWLR